MINFTEGQINLGSNNIFVTSDCKKLNSLAEEGIIEKRKTGRGTTYYYVEATSDDMRFGAFITLQGKRLDWIRLSWLDSSMKGWEDVSEKAVKDEYHFLLNFTEKMVGRPPDNKKNRQCTWRFKWGQINVSYDIRAFQADIYIRPR